MYVCLCMFLCVCVCVYVCGYLCVCVYVFIQDPDPESDPKLCEKSDPDPKKIIPDPQHCFMGMATKLRIGDSVGSPSFARNWSLPIKIRTESGSDFF